MTKVEVLEREVADLDPAELAAFRKWPLAPFARRLLV
jgi:hypothetical protein